jgi:iron complex transport system substrate-binding protein
LKIVSLLPSATEIVYALGLGAQVEGVTDGCDHPADARSKPVVSSSRLDLAADARGDDVDRAVRDAVAEGESLYALDAELIGRIQPDLILTQDLCRVCAVPSGDVDQALDRLGCRADVLSLDPHSLDDVLDDIVAVGERTGTATTAVALVEKLRARAAAVEEVTRSLPHPTTLPLEWLEPPYAGGHWVPEMVQRAGGTPVLCEAGHPSRPVPWEAVAAAAPEAIVFMPCGYDLGGALQQASPIAGIAALRETPAHRTGRFWVVDATSYFSRPGPRLVDGIELLASLLHPDAFPRPRPGRAEPLPRLAA